MNVLKSPILIGFFLLVLLSACSHEINIVGEGDISSETATRDCLLESQPCNNLIISKYDEIYRAIPREGYYFTGWHGCLYPALTSCGFGVSNSVVRGNWFKKYKLKAKFERLPVPNYEGYLCTTEYLPVCVTFRDDSLENKTFSNSCYAIGEVSSSTPYQEIESITSGECQESYLLNFTIE